MIVSVEQVFPIECTGRLAAIADSLRAVAPITLAELYRVDRLTFNEVTAAALAVTFDAADLDESRLGGIVIEVAP